MLLAVGFHKDFIDVELNGAADDIGWEPVAFISIHLAIIKYFQLS